MTKQPLNRWTAFWAGVREFRSDVTLHFNDMALADAYDRGREWAHRLTFRRYDNG